MFYADTPYVRDDRNPALWRCLYKLDNLIPWLRKRLPKQEQLEVGSGPLKAIAQIYSEHPDYRVDTDPFCKKDGVIPVQNGVVDLSGNVPYLRESYDDEMFDHVVQAEFIPDGQIPPEYGREQDIAGFRPGQAPAAAGDHWLYPLQHRQGKKSFPADR